MTQDTTTLLSTLPELCQRFAQRAAEHDAVGGFVHANYADLREHGLMSAMVPKELGGGGLNVRQMCDILRQLGRACGSTALAFSMHQHLVAATVWKWKNQGAGEPLLRRLVDEQIVLLSTGGADWLPSNGSMRKVEGGYRVSARKIFGSGAPVADLIVTSARYEDPKDGARVLHFAVPMQAEGVRVLGDWDTMGMRATGSHTILFEDVFVPEEAVALNRASGPWHPAWTIALAGALPIFMAAYVGIAESAHALAFSTATGKTEDWHAQSAFGALENSMATAHLALDALIDNAGEFDFDPGLATVNRGLIYKTLCANACKETVENAMTAAGGRSYFRSFGLERLLRDIQGAAFHPLPEPRQKEFTGRVAMGLCPIRGVPRG